MKEGQMSPLRDLAIKNDAKSITVRMVYVTMYVVNIFEATYTIKSTSH